MELWGKDTAFCGNYRVLVRCFATTRAGERVGLPNDFQDAATRITACCVLPRLPSVVICSDPGRLYQTDRESLLERTDEGRASVEAAAGGAA